MSDTVFGIDKGIIRAFGLMVIIVGILTTFFLSEYVASIILGSVFYIGTNGTSVVDTAVIGESFEANNVTPQLLANSPLIGTLAIGNATGNQFSLTNFTVINLNSSVLLNVGVTEVTNGTTLLANYTYRTTTTSKLPITSGTETFLGQAEDDFITSFTNVNTAVKFAAALITVVAVILVFASFLPKRGEAKKNMGY